MSQNPALASVREMPRESDRASEPLMKSHLERVHSALRGRYHWAVILGLIGLVGGGVLGYMLPKPMYRSKGLIEVKPLTPRVLSVNETDRLLPQFDAYVKKQMTLLEHPDVLRPAMLDPNWQQIRPGTDDAHYIRFAKNIDLERTFKTQLIEVYYFDKNPEVAQRGVEVILKSFMKQARQQEQGSTEQVYAALKKRQAELQQDLTDIKTRVLNATSDISAAALEQLYRSRLGRVERLEEDIDQVRMTLLAMQQLMKQASTGVSLQMVAATDSQMRGYLQERFLAEQEILRLQTEFGAQHRVVREKRNVLAGINDMINLYLMEAQTSGVYGANAQEITRLRAQEMALDALIAKVKDEMNEVGRREQAVAQLEERRQLIETNLKTVSDRLDEMELDVAAGGRISVESYGDVPAKPYSDKRNQAAAALAMLGLTVGVGIVVLIGFLDPRIRSFDDATQTIENTPVLGVLPSLPDDLGDPEAVTTAAHCVHNIRTMIQIGASREGQKVFSVTSAGPESGKTSLCMALGLSFAGTGARTLIIDCDLVGGGLTRRAESIIPSTGEHALVRNGLVTEAQLEQGLTVAREQNRYLVEVLVELGHLLPRDVDRASRLMDEGSRGLLDVIKGESLQGTVTQTDVPNLWLLPVGRADEHDVSRLSLNAVKSLLADARNQYDAVIVDTGPTPGSLEASLMGAEADGVIVVVTRGEDRLNAERAVKHLRSFGAKVLGMVFNRADALDMERSGATSVSRRSLRPDMPRSMAADEGTGPRRTQSGKFDPLGSSVARDINRDV